MKNNKPLRIREERMKQSVEKQGIILTEMAFSQVIYETVSIVEPVSFLFFRTNESE